MDYLKKFQNFRQSYSVLFHNTPHACRKTRAFAFANARLFEISCDDIALQTGFFYKLREIHVWADS